MTTRDVQLSLYPDLVPERPQGWIMPSVFRGTNADLIAAIAPMYLTGSVLDVTYGNGATAGGWWHRFTPDPFTFHDLAVDGVDFRCLPEPDESVDAVCFDPPYVAAGGESSPMLADQAFQHRYGIGRGRGITGPILDGLILDGLAEALRVTRRFTLVKCMEFADGTGLHDVPHMVTTTARELGWVKHDLIVHHTGSGPGGHNIFTPKRARRHHSYLLVFTKPVRRSVTDW